MFPSDFILGGVSSIAAAFVTNPLEVIKTRLQLQGELAKRGSYVKPYKGILSAFITVAKSEGLLGLQKGLVPALYFQFILNSVRLSIYTAAVNRGWSHNKSGEISFPLGVAWGAIGGASGAFLSSPFFLIKTQLQAQAAESIAVGYQHKHHGVWHAFVKIYSRGGIKSLWSGVSAAVPRASIGSGVQMGTFGKAKEFLRENNFITSPLMNSFCSGVISGSVTSIALTPPDVVSTRLYNQPVDDRGRGTMYKGLFDCTKKIWVSEGIHGFFKGYWANYLRIGPHSVLVLFFFDQLIAIRKRFYEDRKLT